MTQQLKNFVRSEDGATATEYAILAGGIALVLIVTLGLIGTRASAIYSGAAQIFN